MSDAGGVVVVIVDERGKVEGGDKLGGIFGSPFAFPENPRFIMGASSSRQSIAAYAFEVLEAHPPCVIDEP